MASLASRATKRRQANARTTVKKPTTLRDSLDQKFFTAVCSRSLVYNACWEDPAVDRRALRIGPDDRMLVITSAGCNVLDYALLGDRKSTRLNSSHSQQSRMPSSA